MLAPAEGLAAFPPACPAETRPLLCGRFTQHLITLCAIAGRGPGVSAPDKHRRPRHLGRPFSTKFGYISCSSFGRGPEHNFDLAKKLGRAHLFDSNNNDPLGIAKTGRRKKSSSHPPADKFQSSVDLFPRALAATGLDGRRRRCWANTVEVPFTLLLRQAPLQGWSSGTAGRYPHHQGAFATLTRQSAR